MTNTHDIHFVNARTTILKIEFHEPENGNIPYSVDGGSIHYLEHPDEVAVFGETVIDMYSRKLVAYEQGIPDFRSLFPNPES